MHSGFLFAWKIVALLCTVCARIVKHPERSTDCTDCYRLHEGCYYYTVCNGFGNQLLCHVGHIARAIDMGVCVRIPDAFILDGTQTATKAAEGGSLENVLPTPENHVPLAVVLDVDALLERVGRHGVEARLAPLRPDLHGRLACSFLGELRRADAAVASDLLAALAPSARARGVLDEAYRALLAHASARLPGGPQVGVCLHHRDGPDWHGHCDQWERLARSNWNCRGARPIPELVRQRTSHLGSGAWVFYVGDHGAPEGLRSEVLAVATREEVYPSAVHRVGSLLGRPGGGAGGAAAALPRDLGALLDSFLCLRLPHFIGNSVSTWSALQIARRTSNTTWYNRGAIPLAGLLRAPYSVPIVWTHTEESSAVGKLMLQASVLSALRHMPASALHVLYHGRSDGAFRAWLAGHGVTVHDHHPAWRGEAERLRREGLVGTSFQRHRFLDSGDYFGTWQRIDAPLHVSAEYCLLLDSDTFFVRPVVFGDISSRSSGITPSLAFSTDLFAGDPKPGNAGVTLMNLPFMRETLPAFRSFIFNRTSPVFMQGPAHHGAYLDFYGSAVELLTRRLGTKPWERDKKVWKSKLILHFNGLKPHDLLRFWLTGTCAPPKCYLIFSYDFRRYNKQCAFLQLWAEHASGSIIEGYCQAALSDHALACVEFFRRLLALKREAAADDCDAQQGQQAASR